ncbi:MAG: signal transduction histidine kinase [Pseudohongiellaceae bacterium]|jgi:signal transduction histidine kinase
MKHMNALALDISDPVKAINHICNIDQSVFGIDYLQEMMARAADLLGFPYALIGRPDPSNIDCIRTEVLWDRGELQKSISYALAGTPCEDVYCKERVTIYSADVIDQFPQDLLLQELGVSSYVGAPLFSPENELLGILVFMSDRPIEMTSVFTSVFEFLATRAGMELTREELKNKLIEKKERDFREERLASLGQMVSGVTHDFNNLLSGLLGHAELLDLKLGSEHPASSHVQGILKSIQRSKNITQPLLDFTHPHAKRDGKVTVNHVIAELQSLLTPTLDESIELKTELETANLIAKIDGSHLQQILMNLILNARDAMPLGGKLLIRTVALRLDEVKELGLVLGKNYIKIEVSDSGVGISAENMERIFNPFYSTKGVGKGSGLGLASVHSLVQTYGGVISVGSEVGAGSVFTLYLPAQISRSK